MREVSRRKMFTAVRHLVRHLEDAPQVGGISVGARLDLRQRDRFGRQLPTFTEPLLQSASGCREKINRGGALDGVGHGGELLANGMAGLARAD
jgi:hypothetical protein